MHNEVGKVIGVLALQGDFAKHIEMLRRLGIETKEVRKPEDLDECDGLIIPGGESTVMLRQLQFIGMKDKLYQFGQQKPIFGTCAGLILLSSDIRNSSIQPLGLLDVAVERNAFGRQIESFHTTLEVTLVPSHSKRIEAFFIRAPRIKDQGPKVEVLARYKGEPVLVRQEKYLGACFHPEITSDPTLHRYFISMVQSYKENNTKRNN